jgi:hypothetical protein
LSRIAAAVLLLAVLTGCSPTSQHGAPAAPHLEAELVSPVDITLDWSGTPADTSSTIVEFATEPEGRYTILDFVAASKHTYQHPDLMPNTPFYYRITPVHGPVSEVTVKSIGKEVVRISWTDNASDEDGYLLEIKPRGEPQYRVVAVVDPDSTFTELSILPAERGAAYRIRAYYKGTPSNLAHRTTGAEKP